MNHGNKFAQFKTIVETFSVFWRFFTPYHTPESGKTCIFAVKMCKNIFLVNKKLHIQILMRVPIIFLSTFLFVVGRAQTIIDLAGAWNFYMGDAAASDAMDRLSSSGEYVMLPGSMLTNGKGLPVSVKTQWTGSLYDSSFYFNPYMERYHTNPSLGSEKSVDVKFPFFLTPEYHYVGAAWYGRNIYVPREWKSQRVMLFLERPHIETTVYVNGKEAGHQMSLSVPHVYDVTDLLQVGQSNEIAIRVYNGIEDVCVGQDSHSVTDQTQGNWNGIVGRIELQARPKHVNIRSVRVYPDLRHSKVHVVVDLENNANRWLGDLHIFQFREYGLVYEVSMDSPLKSEPLVCDSSNWQELMGQRMEFDIPMTRDMLEWDEFLPAVYRLRVFAGKDCYETTFGFRDISVDGRQMLINGHPLFIRGTVESCCFPETGYPPTDEEEWMRILRKCKSYGLNMVRFHSYCPPEAAFAAADRVGIYLQPEGPSWPNHGVKLRRGMNIDQYLLEESRRIIDAYGNHPSFVMMAACNEPAGDWVSYCNDWVQQMHDYDSTKVYCGASVGGGWAWDGGSEYHVKGGARGLDWDRHAPSSDDDYHGQIIRPRNYKGAEDNTSPIIAHEQGQWCAFPDFGEIDQYTGVYKARNFEIFRDLLANNGMAQQASKFLDASGRLQTLCYKYEIERNLRTPDYTGFQLLALNDYSGQGTALVGPLNVHWLEKSYTQANQWRQFCSMLVPLARFPRFVYTTRDTLRVPVELYNAYKKNISNVHVSYYIKNGDGTIVSGGLLSDSYAPIGKNTPVGTVVMPLDTLTSPQKMTLVVQLSNDILNQWDFWVYPSDNAAPADPPLQSLYIADSLDVKALSVLHHGGKVLLTAAGRVLLGSDVKQTYLPVFWNTSWFKMRPPHTTGAYIDASHPLFRHGFPTDTWTNLNWWELVNNAQVMNLMNLPANYQPPIQPIDTWHVSRKLGMLVEAKVGAGRLLMTTMDISSDLSRRHVARQMRKAILSYMQSDDFQPSLTLTEQDVRDFFERQAPAVKMFTDESPDELKPKLSN